MKKLRMETQTIPGWDADTLRLFQKTYAHRNRYVNRLPCMKMTLGKSYMCLDPAHRVKLNATRNHEHIDYINASYLHLPETDQITYIATQAPIAKTFVDFWQMISEQKVGVIVMLVVADGLKCERYWPEKEAEFNFEFGLTVRYNGVVRCTRNSVVKEFILTDENGTRKVRHYNFLSWPDHSIPDSVGPLGRFMDALQADTLYQSPVLVHCSAGVGRTGTFCVIDTIMRMERERNPFLKSCDDPIYDMILAFREQRISIVETFVLPSMSLRLFKVYSHSFALYISFLQHFTDLNKDNWSSQGCAMGKVGRSYTGKESIQSGMQGVLVTCFRNVESKCTSELYQLLSRVMESPVESKSDQEETGLSFEDQIKAEVVGLKDRSDKPFIAMDTKGLQCIVFLKALPSVDPAHIVGELFTKIRDREIKSVR